MKKTIRKYAEGGEPKFERSTYERAKAFLREKGHNEETPSLDDRIARARERIAGVMQSMPEPAPRPVSRSAPASSGPAPAVSQDRPAYPTARRVAEESMDAQDADMGRAMQNASVRSIPSRPAPTTPALETEVTRSGRGLMATNPFEEQNRVRLARIEEAKARDAATKREAQQDMLEREMPSRIPRNTMGVRAAQQMEEKGSIYSPDYGRPRAEREQRQSLRDLAAGLERTDEAVQAAKKRADTAAARREAAYADVAGAEDYEAGQAAKRMMREAEAARASRLQNAMGVRANQQMEEKGSIYSPDYGRPRAEREQRQAEREDNAKTTREVERQARQDMLERRRTPIEAAALKPKDTEEEERKAAERSRTARQRRRRTITGPAMMGSPGFKSGGMVSSASKRADGIAQKGKTRGKVY